MADAAGAGSGGSRLRRGPDDTDVDRPGTTQAQQEWEAEEQRLREDAIGNRQPLQDRQINAGAETKPKPLRAALGVVVLVGALLAPVSAASAQVTPSAPDVVAWPGDRSITLVWQPVNDGGTRIIRWEYRQVLPPVDVWLQIPGSGPATTSHTVTSLANGIPYRFEVRAVTFAGSGSPGASRASTGAGGEQNVAPSTTPARPTGLSATAGNSQVVLNWTAATTSGPGRNDGHSAIVSYEYRQKTGSGDYAPWSIIIDSDAATASHVVTGLSNGTTYQFQVRARNANGAGAAAETQPVLVATVPGPPRGLVGQASNRRAVLRWTAASDGGAPITSWQYRQATGRADIADSVAWATIPGSHADTALHTVVGLDNRLVYRFEVRAVNEAGPGIAAATGAVEPGTIPAGPVGFAASLKEGTTDTAILAWRRPNDGGSPIVGYQYSQRAGSGGYGSWQDIPDSGPETGTHEVSGLVAGTPYWFRVRAVNAIGRGAAATTTKPIYPGTVPAAPRNLWVTNSHDAAKGTRQVTLVWDPGHDGGSPVTKWEYKYAATSSPDFDSFYEDQSWVTICDTKTRAESSCRFASSVTLPRAAAQLSALGVATGPGGPELVPVAGETYHVAVRAVNERGNGHRSGVAGTAIPRIVPTTPSAVHIRDAAEHSFRVWWPSSADGGANTNIAGTGIRLRYQLSYRPQGGPWTAWRNESANTATIQNAIAGTRYWVRIRAQNAVGYSGIAESVAYTHGGPPTPGADVLGIDPVLTAEAADSQVTLSLARSTNVGAIGGITSSTRWEYSYKVAAGDYGNWTLNNVGPWFDDVIVDLLENGEPHTFRIRGANGPLAGPSLESAAVIPGTPPLSPAGLRATAGDRRAVLAWTPRSGGPPITRWQICEKNGANNCGDVDAGEGWADIPGSGPATTGHTIENLANGTAYSFLVRAWNAFGRGDRAQTTPVTPGRSAPDAPARVLTTAGDRRVTVTVTVPSDDHGSPVTGYQIRKKALGGAYGPWETVSRQGTETTTTAIVTDVANGISYILQVRAVNAIGTGDPLESSPVTPALVPPRPAVVTADRGNGQVSLAWRAGGSGRPGEADYAAPPTGWQYRLKPGDGDYSDWMDIADSGADTASVTVGGLENGTEYTFQVRAVNPRGEGEATSSNAITPATVPTAPTVTAAAGDAVVTVSWTAGDDGGSAVTAWRVEVDDVLWIDLSATGRGADATTHTVIGLDNGTAYTFTVRAINDVGVGAAGTAEATPATVPSAPGVTATAADGTVKLAWTAGEDGGSAITAWHYRTKVSIDEYGDWTAVAAHADNATLTGLDTGIGALSYTFQVRGVNALGEGSVGTSDEVVPFATPPAGAMFYSGTINGPDYCADLSLGGARLFAHDSTGDGTADVCALPHTRREAIARHNAVNALVNQSTVEYAVLVTAACAVTEGDADCGTDALGAPPAVPVDDGGAFYSGIITGPSFCANRSLGGPTAYPHDSNGDGTADVCALPYTRREAIARQLAGDILAARYPADFWRELAASCRGIIGEDYGDVPADLATDACA